MSWYAGVEVDEIASQPCHAKVSNLGTLAAGML